MHRKSCLIPKPVVKTAAQKLDKTRILMTNGSLMNVGSIAECSPGQIDKTKILMTNGSLMKV